MRILVAGASGQVAQSLVQAAQARGLDLVALGRPTLDLAIESEIARALLIVKPDVVINAAALTAVDLAESEPDAAMRLNADAAGWLAREAAKIDAPILHLSTDYVFDGAKPAPYVETDPTAPLGVYGASKLRGEQLVAAANPQHVILRTAWIYSPFGRNFVKTMLALAATRDEVGVVADQVGNPTYAPAIADALLDITLQLGSKSPPDRWGAFHLAAPDAASWADFAEAIFATSAARGGPTARVRRIATADYATPTRRPANSRLDADKIARTYGVRLPSWRASLELCMARLAGSPHQAAGELK